MRMRKLLCGILLGLTVLGGGVCGSTVVKAEETAELDLNSGTVFPDAEFRKYLKDYDFDENGKLSDDEIQFITDVFVWNDDKIKDLTGIEYLKYLKNLYCYETGITSLDVSHNTELETLWCHDTDITSLDVSQNKMLKSLSCAKTNITDLDVSHNTELKTLWCYKTNITSLDIGQNTELKSLNCSETGITSLDVSQNIELEELSCDETGITSLDVSHNTALEELFCDKTGITSLDVSQNTALKELYCDETGIMSLDVSQNMALKNLSCIKTSIETLDISHNTALEELYCNDTNVISLDVSKNKALTYLQCQVSGEKDAATDKYLIQMTRIKGAFDASKVSNVSNSASGDQVVLTDGGFLLTYTQGKSGTISYKYDNRLEVMAGYYMNSINNTPGGNTGDNISDGNTIGDNTSDGNTAGDNISDGNTASDSTYDTTTSVLTKGSVVTDSASQAKYKVTDAAKKTVEYTASTQKKAKKVTVPASVKINGVSYKVTSVAKNAFAKNTAVTTITIGNNVTSIGANAFSDCKKLTSVTIGKNVKSIGKKAFYNCKKLKTITIKSTKLTKKNVGAQAFKNVNVKAKVKVPKSMVKSYQKLFVSKGLNKKVKIAKI